jgi:hypothetical protein
LESAVFLPQAGYYGELTEEAAARLESLVNNHAFVDGNKRVGSAAARLANGFDLGVSSNASGDFMIRTIADGKSRFCAALRWDCSASCASSWISGQERPRRAFGFAGFGRISTVNYCDSPFLRFDLYV